jgi:hypothetical protein
MRTRGTSGQSTVEYIAIVALVAIVFAVAGAFTLNGRAIAAATIGQLKRGLCIVEGHDCPEVHPPCPVSTRSGESEQHVDIAFVHIGHGKSAVVERNSDGDVFVTVAEHLDLGLTTGLGAGLKLRDKLAMGGEARAEALASLGKGKTYKVASEAQADALLAALHRGDDRGVPAPVSNYIDGSLAGKGVASLGGVVNANNELAVGGRWDRVTGTRTIYLKAGGSLDANLNADSLLSSKSKSGRGAEGEVETTDDDLGVSGGDSGEVRLALTLDRHNHPIDLMALGSGELHASADLPPMLQPVAGHLPTGYGRSWEMEAHLDLSQPGRGHEVLANLLHPSRLAHMVLNEGTVQVRGYAARKDVDEISGQLKVGLVVGAGKSETESSRRLIAAMEHTPEGFWVPRYDCVAAAGSA